jgi:hypothetical protein
MVFTSNIMNRFFENNDHVLLKIPSIYTSDDGGNGNGGGDDDDDNDIADLGAYNMGYRDGRFDKLNNMPFSDIPPFDDDEGAETWYKIGYSVGWNSIVGESPLIIK